MLRCFGGYTSTQQVQSNFIVVFLVVVIVVVVNLSSASLWLLGTRSESVCRSMGLVIYPLLCGFTSPISSLSLTRTLAVSLWQIWNAHVVVGVSFVQEVYVEPAYRDVAARRSVTEILKQFFFSFLLFLCCCFFVGRPFCWWFWRQIFGFLQSFFFVVVVVIVSFLLTCCPKSRVEKFTQRSVANEFPLLRHWALGLFVVVVAPRNTSNSTKSNSNNDNNNTNTTTKSYNNNTATIISTMVIATIIDTRVIWQVFDRNRT